MASRTPLQRFTAPVALVAAIAAGCGQAHEYSGRRVDPLGAVEPRTSDGAVASWRYHPSEAGAVYAQYALDGERMLRVGARGERWIVDVRVGEAQASPWLIPEDVRAVERAGETRWLFVGQSGTVYQSSEPIGRIERSHAPPEPLVRVAGAGGVVVGVRANGALLVSHDAGVTWNGAGPADVRFVDAAIDEEGDILALAVPEALWSCPANGAACKAAGAEPFGALEIQRTPPRGLVVRGLFETRPWQVGRGLLGPSAEARARRAGELGAAVPRGENAAALLEGTAVLSNATYTQLVSSRRDRWQLVAGQFGGRLDEKGIPELSGCGATRLAAFDKWIAVACVARTPKDRVAERTTFYRSEDRGRTWSREPFAARATGGLRLALGRGGALLVTGICAPHEGRDGCEPRGIYHRGRPPASRGKESGLERGPALVPSAAPGLSGPATALTFSTDGRRAYAVGQHTKDNLPAVFASNDLGRSFEARDAELSSEYEDTSNRKPRGSEKAIEVQALTAAPDGTVSLVTRRGDTLTLLVTDEEGRAVSVTSPPEGTSLVAAAGSRALAFSPDQRGLFESLDGGSTWAQSEPIPRAPCPGDRDCRIPVFCGAGGCVIGDESTRVGWGTEPVLPPATLPPPEPDKPRVTYRLKTPIACTADRNRPYKPLPTVRSAPTAAHAALGDAVWFAVAEDPNRATASMLTVRRHRDALVESTLLGPVVSPEDYAFTVVRQVEGAAALRYRTPESKSSPEITNVEVAYNNLFEGALRRAKLASAGAYRPGDYIKGTSRAQTAQPSLLSIAQGGLYLRVHQAAGSDQPTYYLDGQRVITVPAIQWPSTSRRGAHNEMARVGGRDLPLFIGGEGAAVAVARRRAEAWNIAAFAIGPEDPGPFGLSQLIDITYVAGGPALHTMLSTDAGDAQALAFPLSVTGPALGTPLRVPTQGSTSDPPTACSDQVIQTSPRLVVPPTPVTRHPVLVDDIDGTSRILLTAGAVIHGTPESACVAVLDARSVSVAGNEGPEERAILDVRDLRRSWLFRKVKAEGNEHVEVRPIQCEFDPKAEVPEELGEALRKAG